MNLIKETFFSFSGKCEFAVYLSIQSQVWILLSGQVNSVSMDLE